jgi:galactosyl transferase GMA12/MNN10 family
MRRAVVIRKALVTIGVGPLAVCLEVALPSFECYAARHGYELIVGDGSTADDRPAAWAKIPLLQEVLRRFDFALWIDADALIVDPSQEISDDLRRWNFQGLVRHSTVGTVPNTGVWALRSGSTSQRFLADVWEQRQFINHPWWENAAAMIVLGYGIGKPNDTGYAMGPVTPVRNSRYRMRTGWLDKRWNSIVPDPADQPRIKHWAGQPYAERLIAMRSHHVR